nr:hypothetical protein [uncultured Desulfobacter sp.]
MNIKTVFFLLFSLCIIGCSSSKATWYKAGSGQADFNIDNAQCRVLAEQMGREATLTWEKINLKAYAQAYESCIYNRGWSKESPVGKKAKTATGKMTLLAELKDGGVSAFNRRFSIPEGFFNTGNTIATSQGIKNQFLTFQNGLGMAWNLTFQQTGNRMFEKSDFPLIGPFFIYDKGGEPKEGKKIRWTVFAGEFQDNWVAGIGCYLLLDSAHRVTIILTSEISAPDGIPPKGLRLTKNQKNDVNALEKKWIHNFKTAFGGCPDCIKQPIKFGRNVFLK